MNVVKKIIAANSKDGKIKAGHKDKVDQEISKQLKLKKIYNEEDEYVLHTIRRVAKELTYKQI
jgi:hypothetical protein